MASSPEVAGHDYPEVIKTQAQPELVTNSRHPHVTNSAGDYFYNEEDAKRTHATMFGMRRRNFWVLLVIAIVLVGATIGGSIGGSLAVRNNGEKNNPSVISSPTSVLSTSPTGTQTPSQSSTPSDTVYVAPPFTKIASINGTCPSSNFQSGIDVPELYRDGFFYDCLENVNIWSTSLMGFSAYTLQQCVDACSQYNNLQSNRTCMGITLNANMSYTATAGNGMNCWLKGATVQRETRQGFTTAGLK